MKRFLIMFFSIFSVIALSACDDDIVDDITTTDTQVTTEQTTEMTDVEYDDGIYEGRGADWEYGYETAEVTIVNGQITEVILRRMQLDGTEVDYEEWTGANDRPDLKQMRIDMANEIIAQQSVENVDAFTGATVTTVNWINAVEEALDKANKNT